MVVSRPVVIDEINLLSTQNVYFSTKFHWIVAGPRQQPVMRWLRTSVRQSVIRPVVTGV